MEVILENKVQVVASIITRTELRQMNHPDFYDRIKNKGLESIEFSIHDKWLPNSIDNFMKVVEDIVEHIRNEKTILVHCNGGRGRTGLIVGACIIILGYPSDQAIQLVRSARSGMLRNPAQEVFLRALQSKLQSGSEPDIPSPILSNRLASPRRKTTTLFEKISPRHRPKEGGVVQPINIEPFASKTPPLSPRKDRTLSPSRRIDFFFIQIRTNFSTNE